MGVSDPSFTQIWRTERIRNLLLSNLDDDSLCALRLTSSECCLLTTSILFARVRLNFTPSSLSRPSRLDALSRIGHHIHHLIFSMPHTDSTFLPPLLNPMTGQEVTFLYTPHTSVHTQRPKYGTQELGDILTHQYPPIFHAATNVPSFIRAMSFMPNLRHLSISCPNQEPAYRYRRDAVDYALISLRIAVERAHLVRLEKLSLHTHAAGLLYFHHMPGFGSSPIAGRRWRQIRQLKLSVDSWDFKTIDHLKIIEDFIRGFSTGVEKISFRWNGGKGPCPFTLGSDPLFAPPKKTSKLFAEITSPMSPLPAAPPRPAMRFPRLRHMQVSNATISAEQIVDLVGDHAHSKEIDFENVALTSGKWEEVLDTLNQGSDKWHQSGSECDSLRSHSQSDADSECVKLRKKRFRRRRRHQSPEAPTLSPTVFEPFVEGLRRMRSHKTPTTQHETEQTLQPTIFKPILQGLRNLRHRERPKLTLNISAPLELSTPTKSPAPPEVPGSTSTQTPPPDLTAAPLLKPTLFDPTAFYGQINPSIQGVQRNRAQEQAQQELVDDVDKRVSTLRKAREVVLARLGSQFKEEMRRKRTVEQMVPLMIFR